jgi:hypothetical protein
MSIRSPWFMPLALGFFSLFAIGCGKTVVAGGECTELGEIQCIDDKTGGFCVDGKYEALACEGATGCMSVAGKGSCTHTEYVVGEACFTPEGEPQCTGDGKGMITCEKNHWVLTQACTGKLGCVANAKGATCDLAVAAAGDACTPDNEGNASCTDDGKLLLLCKGGKMEIESTCKGMHGCRQMGKSLECNSQIADIDDPCDRKFYDGKFACTPDNKAMLVCTDGKFIKKQDCECNVMINEVTCKG